MDVGKNNERNSYHLFRVVGNFCHPAREGGTNEHGLLSCWASQGLGVNSVVDGRWCVAIVGGHELWSAAMCMLLSRMLPNAIVLEAEDENDPIFKSGLVNLVLFCLSPPYLTGLESLLKLRTLFQAVPLILISDAEDNVAAMARRACRASCYLRTTSTVEDLWSMVATVLNGKLDCCKTKQRAGKKNSALTSRQKEVLTLLCQGRTNKEIGITLRLSDNTVRTHVSAIFNQLGVRNRTEAASLAKYLLGLVLTWSLKLVWGYNALLLFT
jgi:two-component system nitrate/nitrite response regulator NarL